MESQALNPVALQALVFAVGLAVGSFLNVLALRTLSGASIVWPASHCPRCQKGLAPYDNIPLLSFALLRGKCRNCQAKISWQYPLVEFVTAVLFVVLFNRFGFTLEFGGMAFFVATLVAVTITDFKEKLIPHDITYPAMLIGIAYSAFQRNDLLGAMAGVGASYIIFDFLAHYGLKAYWAIHGGQQEPGRDPESDEAVDAAFPLPRENPEKLEEFEVMGGGDAVLSAVISSWLGWQRLATALCVGFIVGTVMGMIFLFREMRAAGILSQCYRPAGAGAAIGFVLGSLPAAIIGAVAGGGVAQVPWLPMGLLGMLGGILIGIVAVGTRVSRPFPFGPALAVGGLVAIFWDPVGALLNGGA